MPRKKADSVPLQFDPAEDVEKIGNDLIARFHPHLANCHFAYLFRNKRTVRGGKEAFASAEKCSAKTKALVSCAQKKGTAEPFDFCIVVSYEAWRELSEKQKSALIDHELSHCFVDETDEGEILYSIRKHDIEEFVGVARRWGPYSHDLTLFKSAINGEDEKEEVEEKADEPAATNVIDKRSAWTVGKGKKKAKPKQTDLEYDAAEFIGDEEATA